MDEESPDDSADDDLQAVLDALHDPTCRSILKVLDEPMTVQELMAECDLPQTTTYRKLELLSDASLLEEATEIRDDGHHTTRYHCAIGGIYVEVNDSGFDLTVVPSDTEPETVDERLAWFWSQVSDEL